jgi:hypothetical protein
MIVELITATSIALFIFILIAVIIALAFKVKFDRTKDKKLIMWYSEIIDGTEVRNFIQFGKKTN